jgi:hypothetical protein
MTEGEGDGLVLEIHRLEDTMYQRHHLTKFDVYHTCLLHETEIV